MGGVESQTTLMADWLSARGHRVGLVTWVDGPPHDEVVDGVRVFKTCRRDEGLPLVRFFHPSWTTLFTRDGATALPAQPHRGPCHGAL